MESQPALVWWGTAPGQPRTPKHRLAPRPGEPGSASAEFRDVQPFPLLPALEPEFRELHAARAFHEVPAEPTLARDVPEKELPLRLERVLHRRVVGHFLPAREKIDRLRD